MLLVKPGQVKKRSLLGRMRSWARHTPNGTIALTLISLGSALIFLAIVLAALLLGK